MKTELLPCPFCGGVELEPVQTENDGYAVYCADCYATGPEATSKQAALTAWNQREA
jgi:Lar family restriction alleviation protein